ncbi:MAG: alpha/beta hydrolase [Ktedonobacteraceae bacterium]|nr:alpha/beta hydrolase [Ktedonobacteraceae bacterium]
MSFAFRPPKDDVKQSSATSFISRRTLFRYLGGAAVVTAFASHLQASTPVPSASASGGQPQQTSMDTKHDTGGSSGINVVLVHGAFVDASSWSRVTPILQQAGHHILAVQIPLTSLADDIDVTRQALASVSGPTVLVGHSYAGAVITGAGNASNVVSLVYIAAHAPAEGESPAELSARYPTTPGAQHFVSSYRQGFLWLDPPYFPQTFVADIDLAKARVLAVSQKPIRPSCFTDKAGPAAWRHLPSWYAVSLYDQTIDPHLERWLAKRMHATTREIPSSHASPVSHPAAVAQLILEATRVGKKG